MRYAEIHYYETFYYILMSFFSVSSVVTRWWIKSREFTLNNTSFEFLIEVVKRLDQEQIRTANMFVSKSFLLLPNHQNRTILYKYPKRKEKVKLPKQLKEWNAPRKSKPELPAECSSSGNLNSRYYINYMRKARTTEKFTPATTNISTATSNTSTSNVPILTLLQQHQTTS